MPDMFACKSRLLARYSCIAGKANQQSLAGVAESADALDSKSSEGKPRVGSSPTSGIHLMKTASQSSIVEPFFVGLDARFLEEAGHLLLVFSHL